jgi:hypothetical protein
MIAWNGIGSILTSRGIFLQTKAPHPLTKRAALFWNLCDEYRQVTGKYPESADDLHEFVSRTSTKALFGIQRKHEIISPFRFAAWKKACLPDDR